MVRHALAVLTVCAVDLIVGGRDAAENDENDDEMPGPRASLASGDATPWGAGYWRVLLVLGCIAAGMFARGLWWPATP